MQPRLPPPASVFTWQCCGAYQDRDEFYHVVQQLDLSLIEKQVILSRFIHLIEHIRKRVRIYAKIYYIGHATITVGSLFVPALLSIQNSTGATAFSQQIYWATFIISLLVTTCNGIITLFKIDRRFIYLNTTLERLRTEGWQYIGLTGRYAASQDDATTHRSQFVFFTHQVEKIKMRQVEEEYNKSDDSTTRLPTNTKSQNDLHPLSPERPVAAEDVPEPVKDALSSMLHAPLRRGLTVTGSAAGTPLFTASIASPSPLFPAPLFPAVQQNEAIALPVRSEV